MRILVPAFLLLLPLCAEASHEIGFQLRYEREGTKYRIYLVQYNSCYSPGFLGTLVHFRSSCDSFDRALSSPQGWMQHLSDTWSCPGTEPSCDSLSSAHRVLRVLASSDTVSLPPCNGGWTISVAQCCRGSQVANIQGSDSSGRYVEAFLNNTVAGNSSPTLGNHPPVELPVGTSSSAELFGPDPDGDSVAYTLIPAREHLWWAQQQPNALTYTVGHTAQQPLGSGTTLNSSATTISINPSNQGRFAVVLRASEYRVGQLVGYSERDWDIRTLPMPSPPGSPQSTPSTPRITTTVAGTPDSILLKFLDPSASDILTVSHESTPPGVNFPVTVSDSTGVGQVTAKVKWTVPASWNTIDSPYFVLRFRVADNRCPTRGVMWHDLLVQVDSPHTSAVRQASETAFTALITPNPSNRAALLQLNVDKAQTIHLSVADAVGRRVWTKSVFANGSFALSLADFDMPSGIYFVRLQPADGSAVKVLKWVRE